MRKIYQHILTVKHSLSNAICFFEVRWRMTEKIIISSTTNAAHGCGCIQMIVNLLHVILNLFEMDSLKREQL